MPRTSRTRSESGFYHVILRGNGKQLLFESDEDRARFLTLLRVKTRAGGISVIAWCLMSNHIHLLLDDPQGNLSHAMHALATAYARHFNDASSHVGVVFQGRFTSVPIADERQLLRAVRYIHDNPEKAGIAPAREYRWSSYGEYLSGAHLISDELVLGLIGGREHFEEFSRSDRYSGYYVRSGKRVSDDDVLLAARSVLDDVTPTEVKGLEKACRDDALRALRQAGLTCKQIERLTGIGASVISRVTAH